MSGNAGRRDGGGASAAPRLSPEAESRMLDRLYTESINHKEVTLRELDARYYPVAPRQTIPNDRLQQSVQRQVDQEMQRRQQRRVELEAAAAAPPPRMRSSSARPKDGHAGTAQGAATLTPSELDASVQRLYDNTLAQKKANMTVSEQRYLFNLDAAKGKTIPAKELQESVNRMSKPKKTAFTVEEINKIYGLS